ncbi:MAG: STAS domain-containing protein, partial [Bacilli bacterium]
GTIIINGAVSPMSGIIHGIVVLIILLILAPFASNIPLASLAPVLMIVAWNMSERKVFIHILKTKTSDSIIITITFLLTVFTNLTTAVEVGLLLSVILFVKRMSEILTVDKVLPDPSDKNKKVQSSFVNEGHDCPQISMYTIDGPLFFGAAQTFEKYVMDTIHLRPKMLLLRMANVPYMDTTGESNLSSIVKHFQKQGGILLISEIKTQPMEVLNRTGLAASIGYDHFFEHTGDAITFSLGLINLNKCVGCKQFAFQECVRLSSPVEDRPNDRMEGYNEYGTTPI